MSFGRLFRQQLKQALRRKEFTIALAVVMLLCLLSFLYYCKEFQGAERNSVFPAYDAFAGNYSVLGLAGNLKIFFPILAVLPFADSFLVDRKLGEQTLTLTRATPSRYYWAKGAAVFLSAFLVFFIPLLTNYLLNFLAFPIESYSHFGYDSSSGWYYDTMGRILFAPVFWNHPYLYNLLFVFYISAMCGLVALFTYALSFLIRNRLVTLFLLFFLNLSSFYLESTIYNLAKITSDYGISAYIFAFADRLGKNYVFYFAFLGVLVIGSVALICWKSARRRDVL